MAKVEKPTHPPKRLVNPISHGFSESERAATARACEVAKDRPETRGLRLMCVYHKAVTSHIHTRAGFVMTLLRHSCLYSRSHGVSPPGSKGSLQILRIKVCLHILASSAQNLINVNYPDVWIYRFRIRPKSKHL